MSLPVRTVGKGNRMYGLGRVRQESGGGGSAGCDALRDMGVYMYAAGRGARGKDAGATVRLEAHFTTIPTSTSTKGAWRPDAGPNGASEAKKLYEDACAKRGRRLRPSAHRAFALAPERSGLIRQGGEVTPRVRRETGRVVQGLHDLVLLGLKGSAAYADHAAVLGHVDDDVMASSTFPRFPLCRDVFGGELTGKALDAGKWNIRVLELTTAPTRTHSAIPSRQRRVYSRVGRASSSRARPPRSGTAPRAYRRKRHQRVYPRGDASLPGLSGAQEICPPRGKLRPAPGRTSARVRCVSRTTS